MSAQGTRLQPHANSMNAKKKVWISMRQSRGDDKYVDDPVDRRGAKLKFRFQTRSIGLRAEVGGWKNWNQREANVYNVLCRRG